MKAKSYLNFAMGRDAMVVLGSVILTSVAFNLLSPYISRIPKLGEYQFAIYILASFIIFFIFGRMDGMLGSLARGVSAGILINGLLTIPALSNIRNTIDARVRR